jgi:hypothetical protein
MADARNDCLASIDGKFVSNFGGPGGDFLQWQ